MKTQYPQYGQGQGEWDRNRNEGEHWNQGQDFGRPHQRGFEGQPGQHQQSQREHGGLEYYGSAGGYGGGRGDYAHQGGGQGGQGSYGGGWPGEESQYRGGGGFRQQEAFQSGGRQQGYGEGGGGYGREGEQHFGRQGGMEGYGRGAEERYAESGRQQGQGWGEQGRYQGYGQSPGYYGHQQPGQPGFGQQQGYGQWGSGYGAQRGMGRSSGRKGPKDYVRSDERIREAVCERLMEEQAVDVSDVSVQVKEGRVTLEGTVPDRHMRHIIEDVADDCWGVKDVENHIRVQMPQYGMTTGGQEATGASGVSSTGLSAGSATSQGTPDLATRQPNAAKSSA